MLYCALMVFHHTMFTGMKEHSIMLCMTSFIYSSFSNRVMEHRLFAITLLSTVVTDINPEAFTVSE